MRDDEYSRVIKSDCHCIKEVFQDKYFIYLIMCVYNTCIKNATKLSKIIECTLCALLDIKKNKDCELIIDNMENYKTITYYSFAAIQHHIIKSNNVKWINSLKKIYKCFKGCSSETIICDKKLYYEVIYITGLNTKIASVFDQVVTNGEHHIFRIINTFIHQMSVSGAQRTKCHYHQIFEELHMCIKQIGIEFQ